MARYIDADAYAFPGDLIDVPTADVVEVPCRCIKCKFYNYGICDHYIMGHDKADENDFCSYGERSGRDE